MMVSAAVNGMSRPRPCRSCSLTLPSRNAMTPTSRNKAPFTPAWPSTYTAVPARPAGLSSPTPMRNSPTWLIVENANSRLMWRCTTHITAPRTAVSTPRPSSGPRNAETGTAGE